MPTLPLRSSCRALGSILLAHGGVFTGGPAGPGPAVPVPGALNPNAAPACGPATAAAELEGSALADWWTWWERNRFDYLVPRRAWNASPSTGGDDFFGERLARRVSRSLLSRRDEIVRDRLRPLLDQGLRDPDYNVRSSALLAGGRRLGAAFVLPARAALDDPHEQVRDAALLSLGAGASEEGAALLASVALDAAAGRAALRTGRVPDRTRAIALVSLGMACARGGPETALEASSRVLQDRTGNGRLQIATAAAAALGIAGRTASVPRLVQVASDAGEMPEVRARALAALGAIGDASARPAIEAALDDGDERVRGAAVIALGEIAERGEEPAARRLARRVADEESPAVSGFARISLGKVGGPVARDGLLREVARGRIQDRPFSAIGLALAVRDASDGSARERLRAAFEAPGSPDRRTAFGLAVSLAGGPEVSDLLRDALLRARDLRTRSELPEALAFDKGGEGREALRRTLEDESNAFARGRSAFALGFFCDPRDVSPMGRAMEANRVSSWMGLYSLGLGFHGSDAALSELLRIAEDGGASAVARAAALDGIAFALDDDPVPILHRLSRASNYWADPGFIHEVLAFSL